jgi:membrane protease YdiL (CAAX protease family)
VFLVAGGIELVILVSEILFLPKLIATENALLYDVVSVVLLYGYCLLAPVFFEHHFQGKAMKDVLNLRRYRIFLHAISRSLAGDRSWILKDRDLRQEILPFLAEVLLSGIVIKDVVAYWRMLLSDLARYAMVIELLIAPFAEEFFFRGYLFRGMIEHDLPPLWRKEEFLKEENVKAMVVSTVLFVVPHLVGAYLQQMLTVEYALGSVVELTLFSILVCIAYSWSKDVTLPVLLHAFYNDTRWWTLLL